MGQQFASIVLENDFITYENQFLVIDIPTFFENIMLLAFLWLQFIASVSQPPGRDPVPGPGINYTGPREVLLEFVILVF